MKVAEMRMRRWMSRHTTMDEVRNGSAYCGPESQTLLPWEDLCRGYY